MWDSLVVLDQAPGDPTKVRLIYSGCNIDPGPRNNEYAAGWTREHIWPKSHGGPMTTHSPGIGTDLLNLAAADASVNSQRNDRDFKDLPDTADNFVVDTSPIAGCTGQTLARVEPGFWEPPSRTKGFVARALMYMACEYSDRGLRLVDHATDSGSLELGMLSDILKWNRQFPPEPWEVRRNDEAEKIQQNRNPFIDNPAYADLIWGPAEGVRTGSAAPFRVRCGGVAPADPLPPTKRWEWGSSQRCPHGPGSQRPAPAPSFSPLHSVSGGQFSALFGRGWAGAHTSNPRVKRCLHRWKGRQGGRRSIRE